VFSSHHSDSQAASVDQLVCVIGGEPFHVFFLLP
jgi:hypothetical protein